MAMTKHKTDHKKPKKSDKPKQHLSEPYWDYHEVVDFIEKKYKIKLRGYTPKAGFTEEMIKHQKETYVGSKSDPYLDFWHWICEYQEIHNGCYFYLGTQEEVDEKWCPYWVKEILDLLDKEFPEAKGEMYMYVSW